MKNLLFSGILAGATLLAISYGSLYFVIFFFPSMAEKYYDPVFSMEGEKSIFYFLHPFILSFALAWFWRRFKGLFHGPFWWRGIELGLVYGLVATLPSMWMIFSALAISFDLVVSWFLYGVFQAIIAGIIFAKVSP